MPADARRHSRRGRRRRRHVEPRAPALRPDRSTATARPITTGGAPDARRRRGPATALVGLDDQGDGRPPSGPDEVAIDKATADREDFAVGDTVNVHHRHRVARVHDRRRWSASATPTGSAAPRSSAWDMATAAARCSAPTARRRRSTSASPTASTPATVQPRIERDAAAAAPRSSPASRCRRDQPTASTSSSARSAPAC